MENNNEISIDHLFYYELNGKKNCIIGKKKDDFYIYFVILLKKLEKDDFFTKIIEILQDNPNA